MPLDPRVLSSMVAALQGNTPTRRRSYGPFPDDYNTPNEEMGGGAASPLVSALATQSNANPVGNPFDYGYGPGVNADNDPATYNLLQAMSSQYQAGREANQMRQMPQVPRPRNITALEALVPILAAAFGDRSGQAGASFLGGLNQGIQNRYQGDVAQYNADMQNREMQARERESLGALKYNQANELAQLAALQRKAENDRKMEELKQGGRLSLAQVSMLMKVPPESRASWARKYFGITDADMLDQIASLTTGEQQQSAGAKLAGEQAETVKQERPGKVALTNAQIAEIKARTDQLLKESDARVKKLISEGKLTDARVEESQAHKKIMGIQADYLPESMTADIKLKNAQAEAARARANKPVGGTGGMTEAQAFKTAMDRGAIEAAVATNQLGYAQSAAALENESDPARRQKIWDNMGAFSQAIAHDLNRLKAMESVVNGFMTGNPEPLMINGQAINPNQISINPTPPPSIGRGNVVNATRAAAQGAKSQAPPRQGVVRTKYGEIKFTEHKEH